MLSCSHAFCEGCLSAHILAEIKKGKSAWCPTCRQNIPEPELVEKCPEAAEVMRTAATGAEVPPAPAPQDSWLQQRRAASQWRRAARRAHLKYCPACRVPIEKNHGCDHMRCRCGERFNWSTAESVVPCHRLHRCETGGKMWRLWGSTCAGCSPIAKAKLALWRTTAVLVVAPVAVAVSPIAGGVMLTTATCKAISRRRRTRRLLHTLSAVDSLSDSFDVLSPRLRLAREDLSYASL